MLFAVLGGLAISIQVPTNAALSKHVGALQTTLMSFMLDLCLLALIVALTGSFPGMAGAVGVPLWELLGGFAGAVSVCLTVIATPHLIFFQQCQNLGTFIAFIAGRVMEKYHFRLLPCCF